MSLAINVTTSSGIVLAADSRQSYRNMKGMARIGSDTASKLFQLNKRVGCAITGIAFFITESGLKSINSFVEEFKRIEEVERMDVAELAEKLYKFLEKNYNWKPLLENLKEKIKTDLMTKGFELIGDFTEEKGVLKFKFKDKSGREQQGMGGVDRIDMLVAGFNHDGSHQVFVGYIPGELQEQRNSKIKGKEFGASWIGQIDVTSRIVLGWDGRIFGLPFIQEQMKTLGENEIVRQLRGLEYVINWGTMTLQDAIDFSALMIKTTEAIQKFSDGIAMDPGDMPGVGGDIDIAVITRDKGFVWVKKKNIKIDGKEIDLDAFENLR